MNIVPLKKSSLSNMQHFPLRFNAMVLGEILND